MAVSILMKYLANYNLVVKKGCRDQRPSSITYNNDESLDQSDHNFRTNELLKSKRTVKYSNRNELKRAHRIAKSNNQFLHAHNHTLHS